MNNDFKTLLRIFVDLCLIKKGPKDVPESAVLLKMVFFIYFLSGTLLLSSSIGLIDAIIQSFLETVLVGLFMYVLVSFFQVKNRFNQAVTAIYGSGALMTLLSVPYIFWMDGLVKNENPIGVIGLVVFFIVIWGFIVMANIIRETVQKSFSISLLLTFCYLYLSYQLINIAYPVEVVPV